MRMVFPLVFSFDHLRERVVDVGFEFKSVSLGFSWIINNQDIAHRILQTEKRFMLETLVAPENR
jgi:hypothetical protein